MHWYESAGIGIIMGCLYGVVLWASIDALSLASFILYKNRLFLPEVTTGIVIGLAFLCLFTYTFWVSKLEEIIENLVIKEWEDDDE